MHLTSLFVISCFIVTISFSASPPVFNYTKCPTPNELQTPEVASNFSAEYFSGVYYEIALHDYTQYPLCPKPKCIQSYKTLNKTYGEYGEILDHFSLECVGKTYLSTFYDELTSKNGLFDVIVQEGKLVTKKTFHDTVVATGNVIKQTDNPNKLQYEYVIEFQCIQKFDHVLWVAINFYCYYNQPSQELINEMLDVGYQQGLGVYMNKSLLMVDQSDCTYPNFTTKIDY